MEIKITGSPQNITRAETREVIKWIASEMELDRYRDPIWLNIKFKRNLRYRVGYRGSAVWEDRNHRPREFEIEIDDTLSKRVAISTLIHEMVHVDQYSKEKLKDYLKYFGIKRWCGKMVDSSVLRYRDYPWEIEAYALEKLYYMQWRDYKRKKHL